VEKEGPGLLHPGPSFMLSSSANLREIGEQPSQRRRILKTAQPVEKPLNDDQERSVRCFRARLILWPVAVGGRRAAACASFLGLRPPKASSRFTFCPEAISKASLFTFSSLRSLNLLIPCHYSLASANKGSTHTLLFLRAFSYAKVSR
jgi:hypothetical protein